MAVDRKVLVGARRGKEETDCMCNDEIPEMVAVETRMLCGRDTEMEYMTPKEGIY